MLTDGLRFLEGSTNTNLVLPVVTATAKAALSANAGEVVFQSDGTKGLYVYDGTQWVLGIDISAATSAIAASRLPAFTGDVTSTAGTSALTLAASGVTAGTFKSVTVNAKGLVTAGTNPTTLVGYGITDAQSTLVSGTNIKTVNGTSILGSGNITLSSGGASAFSDLTDKPTTLSGYGITDAVLNTDARLTDSRTPVSHNHALSDVTGLVSALTDKLDKNEAITAGTNAKITYDTNGLITGGASLAASDIPDLSWTKITSDKPTTLSGYGITDAATPTDIATAITNIKASVDTSGDNLKKLYDLIVAGFKEVTVADITARDAYNITSLPTNIFVIDDTDGKWALYKATTTGTAATFIKLSDPDLLNAAVGFNPENSTNKSTDGTFADNSDTLYPSQKAVKTYADTKVISNTAITAGTGTKITYDTKGLVTGSDILSASDIPNLQMNKISGLSDTFDTKLTKNSPIIAGSGSIITFDENGLVTAGAALLASDIPGLSADKITSGVLDYDRLPVDVVYTIDGELPAGLVPTVSLTGTITPNTYADMTAATAASATGTVAIVTADSDLTKNATYVKGTDGTWKKLNVATNNVASINGKTGNIAKILPEDISGVFDTDANKTLLSAKLPLCTGDVVSTSGARNTLTLNTIPGLTAGASYASVTVNAKGLVTGGVVGSNYTATQSDAKYVAKTVAGEKNAANGYLGLNAAGKIDPTYLPAITINSIQSVTTVAERDALTGLSVGDMAIVGGIVNKTFILSAVSPDTWIEMLNPTGGVTSVNGSTGVVNVDLSNIPGTLTVAKMPIYTTGDVITNATSKDLELKVINGLTAGSYTKVTVNTKGIVTSASNPTTIADFGITNAYTKTEVDTAISNATPVLTFTSLTGKPTTITGYGITDAYTKTEVDTAISGATPTFTSLSGKPTTLAGYGITDAVTPTDITTAIDAIKANVPAAGDNLNKLYDLVVSSFKEVTVATVAARDLYNVTALPTNVFVTDDGDGKWALYKATTTGVGATFVKLSDPDLLNAAVSMAFTPENAANKSIDGTFTDNSDITYPSQKAVKTYADTKLAKNVDIVAGTATKITYDAKGLVTAGAALVEADLPSLAISKITNLQTSLDDKLAKNVDIVAGTGTKITYDAKGLVLSSASVTSSDLPTNLVYTTGGKIDSNLLPSIALTNTYVISDVDADATNIDTYAIGATLGSIAILTNISKTYIVSATAPAVVWTELLAPTDSVKSVNGKSGSSISLSYDDIDSGSANIVTAGSYNTVTVNTKGRVTAASNTAYAALDGSNKMNAANLPTFIGDVTLDTATNTLSLSTVANVAGTYNTATAHAPVTIDSKGRVSAVGAAVTITPAFSDITGKPTTLSGYGISDSVELTTRKNAASGYAGLDGSSKLATSVLPSSVVLLNASGKIDTSVLPAVSLSNTFVVSDVAATASNIDTYTTGAAKGDIAILTAISETYILTATTPTKVWTELLSPTGGVTSVNGSTGSTITLTYANIDTASTDIVTAGTYNNVTVNAKGRVTAVANTTYATLDGSSRLLVTNLPAYTGDVTKAAGSAATVVAAVNGTTVVNPATKTAGMVLSLDSDTTQATWKAISLPAIDANGRLVSTALPLFTGDITTTTSSATLTISKINGIPLDTAISGSALPTNGYALTYDSTALKATWKAVAGLGANSFTGTQTASTFTSNVASGTAPFSVTSTTLVSNLNVSKLNGIDITGTPAVGHVLTATSTTAASWASGGGGTSDISATANTIAKRTSDGSLYATNFYSTSDLLLKANVQELSDNLDVSDAISKLAPKAFTFKDDSENKQHYGLIAQDVEEVLPALVSTNDDGFKSVNYVEIIALLLAEVKTLSARVNALESA